MTSPRDLRCISSTIPISKGWLGNVIFQVGIPQEGREWIWRTDVWAVLKEHRRAERPTDAESKGYPTTLSVGKTPNSSHRGPGKELPAKASNHVPEAQLPA